MLTGFGTLIGFDSSRLDFEFELVSENYRIVSHLTISDYIPSSVVLNTDFVNKKRVCFK